MLSATLMAMFAALIMKDTLPIGDQYILRGISQILALVVGCVWLTNNHEKWENKKYRALIFYAFILFLSASNAGDKIYIILQVISLIAVFVISIAYSESLHGNVKRLDSLFRNVAIMLIIVCLGSLALLKINPQLAYMYIIEEMEDVPRFRGLYGMPAAMGSASGILLGLSILGRWHFSLRLVGVTVALPCLFLTGARSFWFAAIVGLAITLWRYSRRRSTLVAGALATMFVIGLVYLSAQISVDSRQVSRMVRAESLETMTGRTSIWISAFEKFQQRPLLGYGFTIGGDALTDNHVLNRGLQTPKETTRGTLHNGYIQALLDAGTLGGIAYLTVLISAFLTIIFRDSERSYGCVFYLVIFFSIANFGESVIMGSASFPAAFFWFVAIVALSLKHPKATKLVGSHMAFRYPPSRISHLR